MSDPTLFGKLLVGTGALFVVIGLLPMAVGKLPFLGHLPGDIYIRREHFSFFFPPATCVLLSVVVSLFLGLFGCR